MTDAGPSPTDTSGLHHVTAICGDAQENLDFYAGTLGMRLVKRSVNQDDPGTYHLFYADGAGSPGSDLTFFPWPHMPKARHGNGLAREVALAIPAGTLGAWHERLEGSPATAIDVSLRFGERTIAFDDPHGMRLALIESDAPCTAFVPWPQSPVSPDLQIRALHSCGLPVRRLGPSAALLTGTFGFSMLASEDGWTRYALPDGAPREEGTSSRAPGTVLDLIEAPGDPQGHYGVGAIHHLAWRVRDDEHEAALRSLVQAAGLQPTSVIDRFWFRSVYFREPGGVLFELATDGPGFAVDEHADHLGETLVLPPWLEERRQEIEAALPALRLP